MNKFPMPTALAMLVLLAMIGPGNALSQDRLEARLLVCDAVSDPSSRMQCFDDIVESIRTVSEGVQTSPSQAPVGATEPVVVTATDSATNEVEGVVAETTATGAAVEVASAVEPSPTEFVGPPVENTGAHEETSMTVDETERGYQPVERKPLEDAPLPSGAQIVEVWTNNDGRFSVRLDNGQVWRETQGSRVGKPKVGRSIEVMEGRFGGERMRIEGIRRIAWVRRTE